MNILVDLDGVHIKAFAAAIGIELTHEQGDALAHILLLMLEAAHEKGYQLGKAV